MRAGALLALALALVGCATPPRPGSATTTTFVVVRHAEKLDASGDPPLSVSGQARAMQLGALLGPLRPGALYTTDFQRTRQTLAPLARALRMEPVVYDARQPAAALAAALKAAHPRGTVVVAGHSNTVPAIVSALCGCATEPMAEDEYDRLNTIRIDDRGNAVLRISRYGATPARP